MGSKDVVAKEPVIDRHQPVGQRRLLQIANAIDLEGDPVAGERHMLGCAGMVGIGVIQQRRGEKGGQVNRGEDQQQQCPGS